MIRIHTYGDPILRAKARAVENFDKEVRKLAEAMIELMIERHGVGLAAQQVGETIRIFTVYVPPQYDVAASDGPRLNPEINDPMVMINPVILTRTGAQSEKEGCLSIPEIFVPVRRAYEVSVSFLDPRGRSRQVKARGLLARAIQHELDHLDGILFVDRISALKKLSLTGKLRKIRRATEREIAVG